MNQGGNTDFVWTLPFLAQLRQGLPFHGHDESESSESRGNFLELVKFVANLNELIANIVSDNAPKNHTMVSADI